MYKKTYPLKVSILMIIVLLIPVTSVFASGGNDFITYEVTLDNLTMDYASVGGRFDHQHSLINQ